MAGFSGFDIVILVVAGLLLFGPQKLPEIGSAIGKTVQTFKRSLNEIANDDADAGSKTR